MQGFSQKRLTCVKEDYLGSHVEIAHRGPRVEASRPTKKPAAAIQVRNDGG